MSREVRSRVALGIGIPLAAFVFLAALILSLSRILLAVPDAAAPWVALMFAATILAGCTLAATIQGTRGFAFLIGVLVLTIVGGGIVGLALGEYPRHSLVAEEHEGAPEAEGGAGAPAEQPPPPPPEGGGGAGGATLVAQDLAFNVSEISVPAGGEATIALDNQDQGIIHNLGVYTEAGGEEIFAGDPVTGPAQTTYRFPAPDPGQYHFQCDFHPTTMAGSLTVG